MPQQNLGTLAQQFQPQGQSQGQGAGAASQGAAPAPATSAQDAAGLIQLAKVRVAVAKSILYDAVGKLSGDGQAQKAVMTALRALDRQFPGNPQTDALAQSALQQAQSSDAQSAAGANDGNSPQ